MKQLILLLYLWPPWMFYRGIITKNHSHCLCSHSEQSVQRSYIQTHITRDSNYELLSSNYVLYIGDMCARSYSYYDSFVHPEYLHELYTVST